MAQRDDGQAGGSSSSSSSGHAATLTSPLTHQTLTAFMSGPGADAACEMSSPLPAPPPSTGAQLEPTSQHHGMAPQVQARPHHSIIQFAHKSREARTPNVEPVLVDIELEEQKIRERAERAILVDLELEDVQRQHRVSVIVRNVRFSGQCAECGRHFSSKSALARHFVTRHLAKPTRDAGNSPQVQNHTMQVPRDTGASSQVPSRLRGAQVRSEKVGSTRQGSVQNGNTRQADRKAKQIGSFLRHEAPSVKKYRCPADASSKQSVYTRQQRTHAGEGPHRCQLCDETFSQAQQLMGHIQGVHIKICTVSMEKFGARGPGGESSVNCEMSGSGHSDKKYRCQYCAYDTDNKEHLLGHQLTHSGERPYQCQLCDRTFSKASNLKSHVRSVHAKDEKFSCAHCQFTAAQKDQLATHIGTHFIKKPGAIDALPGGVSCEMSGLVQADKKYRCQQCAYATNKQSDYTRHQRTHSGERPYQCHLCDRTFSQTGNLMRHVQGVHMKLKKYSCAHCHYTAAWKDQLVRHIRTRHFIEKPGAIEAGPGGVSCEMSGLVHSDKKYRRQQCAYSTNHKGDYTRHQRTHSSVRPYQCQLCDKAFSQPSTLMRHLQGVHIEFKEFSCAHCHYTTARKDRLATHIGTRHSIEELGASKPGPENENIASCQMSEPVQSALKYQCKNCTYSTGDKHNFYHHQLSHTGEKPHHQCEFCKKIFSKVGNLNRHVDIVHIKTKKFTCPQCPYAATLKEYLTKHIRIHTGERPYVCRYCDFATTQSCHLQTHLATHTGEKRHACPHCKYTCIQSGDMKKHIRRKHGEAKV